MKWPGGARSAGVPCGIKGDGKLDLGLLVLERPAAWAGTFTQNAAAAAPVLWSRAKLGAPVRALVVNSGNANACTGASGPVAVHAEAEEVARHLGCGADEVLVASTGPIGVPLPVQDIIGSVPSALAALETDVSRFADSILTTDTRTKIAQARAGSAEIVGVGKGAAMLAPNMATMLAFLVTDATVDVATLQKVLDVGVHESFNRISVDACESTNDSVFLFATGPSGEVDIDELCAAVASVCRDLATQMVRDAEGGSKLVRIVVVGASDEGAACSLGRSVASSALWRAAAFGNDPNWGRVLAALGTVDRSLEIEAVSISIGGAPVFHRGEPLGDLEPARRAMEAPEFVVHCSVGEGRGTAEFLTSDLSAEYVTLNSEGTS